ncbi:MAG: helix-turn-helix transcriptional regulator [Bacillota bacterium]
MSRIRHSKSSQPQLPSPAESSNSRSELERSLRERIKELECLYFISNLRESHRHSIDHFLQGAVNYLPKAWQYPEYACARISDGTRQFISEGFQESRWRMAADVQVDGKPVGSVEVFYRKGVPVLPDGPFLKEESALIRAVAERVSTALADLKVENELQEAHEMLRGQHQALQETNIALRTVLARLEDEKREIRASTLANIQKIVMPIVFELELTVTGRQRSYVTLLRQSLQEIASPFLSQLSRDHLELTPVEVAISTMIRNGLSTKEIAQLRCISEATVRRHRENIRNKLGLRNRKANLVTYLQSASPDSSSTSAD